MQHVVLVTGKQGSGKSTLLGRLVNKLLNEPVNVTGFLQPSKGLDERNERIGYDIRLINGETIPLAKRNPDVDHSQVFQSRPTIPKFIFDENAFTIARKYVLEYPNLLEKETLIIVIDELGWIEDENGGHWPVICELVAKTEQKSNIKVWWLFSVRKTFEHSFCTKLSNIVRHGLSDAEIFDIDSTSIEQIETAILGKILH
jgi:nucleoside-triphosphatase THEP1